MISVHRRERRGKKPSDRIHRIYGTLTVDRTLKPRCILLGSIDTAQT